LISTYENDQINEYEVEGACSMHGGEDMDLQPLRRPRHRGEGNIKMDFKEMGFEGVEWIYLAQDGDQWRAVVNNVMSLHVP
jgi:hypothetical protein